MHGRRLSALIIKEALQIVRDPSTILISVILPLFLMFLYGYGVSLDLDHLRLGVALEDTTPTARTLLESFQNSRYFDVTIVRDYRELLDPLQRGDIRGFVVIPPYFTQFLNRKSVIAPIQVVGDGSEPNTANFVQNYVEGAFRNWINLQMISQALEESAQITPATRFWYNEQLESRYFLLPGSLAIIMTLIGTLLTALVVAREWERGTMEALISTNITRGELILGKLVPYFVLGMISMAICFLVTVIGFSVPFRGSIWLLAIVSAVFLYCALALGFMISTLARNQLVAYQISIITGFLPAYILSGFLFEIDTMPFPIRMLTYVIPARYFVRSLQTLFLVGDVWSLILRSIFPLLIVGTVFFTIAAHKTVKRLD